MTAALANPRRSYVIALIVAFVVLALDQATKWWILDLFAESPRAVDVLPFFKLVLAWNRGVSFSMFASGEAYMPYVLSAVAVAIVAGLLYWARSVERDFLRIAVGLIVGGAIGNVVDRLRFGAVVDFLYVHIGTLGWPAFNVADSAITVGVLMILADGLFGAGRARSGQENVRRKEPS